MDYKIITDTYNFELLKKDWERLEQQSKKLTYYSTFQYAKCKWDVQKKYDKYNLFIICIIHNNVIIGIAPLLIERIKNKFFSWNCLKFLAVGDYADFIIDEKCEVQAKSIYKQIFKIVFDNDILWDEIRLSHIPYFSNLIYYLLSSEYNKNLFYLIENPFINMSNLIYNNKIDTAQIPEKTIQYSNRLKKLTNYNLVITRKNYINQFSKIHIAEKVYLQKKGLKNRHSLFENKEEYELFNNLFYLDNSLSYYLFDNINKKIIIYNCGFVYNNIYYSINTGYEPEYSNLGVGKIIYYEIFKENLSNPLWEILDAGTGRYSWKFEWANGFNLLYQFYMINHNSKKLKIWRKLQKIKNDIKS